MNWHGIGDSREASRGAMKAELLKGHLDGLLLATLESGPQHGYGMIEALRTGSTGLIDLPSGTIYPALHRLERHGLIESEWSSPGGRRRRLYRLTADGTRKLNEHRETWTQLNSAISRIMMGGGE